METDISKILPGCLASKAEASLQALLAGLAFSALLFLFSGHDIKRKLQLVFQLECATRH